MTEYDYSPAAYDRYMRTQNRVSNWVSHTKAHSRQYSNPFVPSAAGSVRADSPAPASRTASPAPMRDREDSQLSQHSQPRRSRSSGSGSASAALTVRPAAAGPVAPRDAGPKRSRTLDSREFNNRSTAAAVETDSRTTGRSRSFSTTHDSRPRARSHHSHSRSHSHSQNQNIPYHYSDPHHQPHHSQHRSYHHPQQRPPVPPVPPLPSYATGPTPIRSHSIPPKRSGTGGFVYDRRTGGPPIHLPAGETYVIVPPGRRVDVVKGGVKSIAYPSSPRKEPLLKRLLGSITFSGNGNGGSQHDGRGRSSRRSSY